jgi:hypothetical protein
MNEQLAKREIKVLIDDFKANHQKWKQYSEADVETKLVEELFIKVLGWTKADFNKQLLGYYQLLSIIYYLFDS